jgi:single-stranded-DNA-specific exonuclease
LLPRFADRLDEVAHRRLTPDDLVPELRVDLTVPIDAIGDSLEQVVRHFEPFGVGNPAPVFTVSQARLASTPRRVGTDGVKLSFDLGHTTIDAIGWGLANRLNQFDVSKAVDLVFKLERDEYRGVSRLQLRIADARS